MTRCNLYESMTVDAKDIGPLQTPRRACRLFLALNLQMTRFQRSDVRVAWLSEPAKPILSLRSGEKARTSVGEYEESLAGELTPESIPPIRGLNLCQY